MLDFRCKMLDERGSILFSADIAAASGEDAIRHASEVLRTSNQASASRRVYAFEVSSDSSWLFPPPLECEDRAAQNDPACSGWLRQMDDRGVVLSK